MGTSKKPDKMLGGNLRWISIPSRKGGGGGGRNTPSPFILQKPEISAGMMGLLARPIKIGGRLFKVESSTPERRPYLVFLG